MRMLIFVFLALVFLATLRPVFALIGDVNGDGKVDIKDVLAVAKCFGTTPSDPRWNPACDLNGDGKVDIKDVTIVAAHFGQ